MNKVIKDLFTSLDGESFDIGRVLWAFGVITFLCLSAYTVIWQGKAFAMQDFGIGIGATLAAGGAALGFKAKTEPPKSLKE